MYSAIIGSVTIISRCAFFARLSNLVLENPGRKDKKGKTIRRRGSAERLTFLAARLQLLPVHLQPRLSSPSTDLDLVRDQRRSSFKGTSYRSYVTRMPSPPCPESSPLTPPSSEECQSVSETKITK